ncbi:MAG TPA: SUF system Fe-S cluster assembly protein [Bacteroidetes bacterium]|jgi:FeS assembly SUF system protein|nr:SUF system Fe-S cluster assembly protein [Bacteroidota bacterium]
MEVLKNAIIDQIKTVFDPEIPVNIYDLGLIYEINVDEKGQAEVIMTLTSPACPVAGSLPGEVEDVVMGVDGVEDAVVELVFDPPWDKEMMSEEAKFELGFD